MVSTLESFNAFAQHLALSHLLSPDESDSSDKPTAPPEPPPLLSKEVLLAQHNAVLNGETAATEPASNKPHKKPRSKEPNFSKLTAIHINSLKTSNTHCGRLLRGTLIVDPIQAFCVQSLLQDELGDVLKVFFYQTTALRYQCGAMIAIAEPYYRRLDTGGEVTVHDPREIALLEYVFPRDVAGFQAEGNTHFSAKPPQLQEAVISYSHALKMRDDGAKGILPGILSSVLLNIAALHLQHKDVERGLLCAYAAVTVAPRYVKAYYRCALLLAVVCCTCHAFQPLLLPQVSSRCANTAAKHIRKTETELAAYKRGDIRMPSSEPQVPYKAPGSDQATWMGVNQRLQRSRIIMVGKYIDDEYANQLIAMMLYLEKESRDKAVALYFNCPGANLRPAMAVFDTLQQMAFPVSTLNLGLSTGMVSFLCAAGDKGMRFALPNARFLMQRTGMEDPYRGQASDIAIEVSQMINKNMKMEEALARITGHSREKVRADLQRDFYLSAAEAVQYGIIDKVLLPRDKSRTNVIGKDLQFGENAFARDVDPGFGQFGGDGQRYGNQSGGGFGAAPKAEPRPSKDPEPASA